MTVVLTHITALECLRSLHFDRDGAAPFVRSKPDRIAPPTKAQVDFLELRYPSLIAPFHCGIGKEALRARRREDVKCHFLQKDLPSGSFLYLEEGVYISSPELCFLQMASLLSIEELILVGFELCGTYARVPYDSRGFKQRRSPLASKKSLARFLSRTKGMYGTPMAQRALRYIRDGAASPMEAALAMLLGLPPSLGGYGLGMPELNVRVDTVKKRTDSLQSYFRRCDLFWSPNLAVEYDSVQEHSGKDSLERDAVRRNDLLAKQIVTMSITPRQVYNLSLFDTRAREIAAFLGKRVRLRVKDFESKRRHLRGVVLFSSADACRQRDAGQISEIP